jgi:cytochrome c oxidase subunit 1
MTPPPDYPRDGHPLTSWLTTTDHKRVAILFALSITVFFFIGAVAIGIVRLELLTPSGALVSDDTYSKLFTPHGTVVDRANTC